MNFKYCFAWANHSWYNKTKNLLLCEQKYLGSEDYQKYFKHCCKHFETDNYIKINGKPVFFIFDPYSIPNVEKFFEQWRQLAQERGFPGIFFVADRISEGAPIIDALEAYCSSFRYLTRKNKIYLNFVKEHLSKRIGIDLGPRRFDFRKLLTEAIPENAGSKYAPTILTGWDTTPRHGRRGVIFEGLDAEAFQIQLADAKRHFQKFPNQNHLLFLKSWNEWTEGNVMEPDTVFGRQFLDVYKAFVDELAFES